MTDSTRLDMRTRRRHRRTNILAGLAIAAAAVVLGYVLHGMTVKAEAEQERADRATAAAEQACQALRANGYPCPFDPGEFRGATGAQGVPGRPPTEAEILAAVQAVYRANPPADGRTPSNDELAALVAAYLLTNPPAQGEPGEQGPQGEPGPPPTSEQVRAAVDAWFAMNPLPVCPAGSHIEEYNPPLDKRTFLVCVKDATPAARR